MKQLTLVLCTFLFLIVTIPILAQGIPLLPNVDSLKVITLDNARNLEVVISAVEDIKQISVSPDSSMIAIASQQVDYDYDVTVFDIETGQLTSQMQGRMDFFRDLFWSPDSERIAVVSGRTTGGGIEEQSVKVYTIEFGAYSNHYMLGNSDVWYTNYVDLTPDMLVEPVQVAWNPTSSLIAIAFPDQFGIYAIDHVSEVYSDNVFGITDLTWSADGKLITVVTSQSTTRVWGVRSEN